MAYKRIINEYLIPIICCLCVLVIHMLNSNNTLIPIIASIIIFYIKFRSLVVDKYNSWISPELIFLAGFFILNFSLVILDLFSGSIYRVIIDDNVSSSSKIEAPFYAFYALSAFYWGTKFYSQKSKVKNSIGHVPSCPSASLCYAITYIFSVLLVCMVIVVGPSYFFGGYQGVYGRSGLANALYYLTQVFGVSSGALLIIRITTIGLSKSVFEFIHLFPYCLLIVLYLLSGDRGELIYLGGPIGFYIALVQLKKKTISTGKVLFFIAVSLFVVGFLRELRGVDDNFVNAIGVIFSNLDVLLMIGIAMTNVGSSGLLVPAALDEVIENGYAYGSFTLNGVLGVFPGIRGALRDAFGYGNNVYLESASLLSDRLLGVGATSGIGTSSVADLIIDLGLSGVIIGHFLLGYLARYITRSCWSYNYWYGKFLFAISLGVFAIIARYSLLSMLVKYVLFPFLLIFFVRKIITFTNKDRHI